MWNIGTSVLQMEKIYKMENSEIFINALVCLLLRKTAEKENKYIFFKIKKFMICLFNVCCYYVLLLRKVIMQLRIQFNSILFD